MKPAAFDYIAPETLEAALSHKKEHGDEAKALAGGQSLIPAMNFRVAQPSLLLDLNDLAELRYIRQENGELLIGAMTTQAEVEHSPLVAKANPLLAETIPNIAHPQIRNRGTLGGSLAHADPASELPVVSLALDARFRAKSVAGERWIPAKEFFEGMFTVTLKPDELLIEVAYPAFPKNTGWSFQEIARRKGDYAMAGLAALVTLDADKNCTYARLVYLNVGDGPLDATGAADLLIGQPITSETIQAAAEKATKEEIMPFGSVHASPEYQSHLSHVLTKRTLQQAHQRALAQNNGNQ